MTLDINDTQHIHTTIMLSVIMLSVIMLSIIIQSIIMMSIIMLNVVMLSVMGRHPFYKTKLKQWTMCGTPLLKISDHNHKKNVAIFGKS